MTKVEFTLADLQFVVHASAEQIVQVFCDKQALALEDGGNNIYHADAHGHQFQFNTEKLFEGQIAIAINGQAWQWIELPAPEKKSGFSFMGLAALGFKLFKSAKVVKAALAGASVAGYAWLFSWQFAIMLIVCLVIHEYGHVRAMQYFKIKTKGIYLIPFVGGLAVSDDKITTRWQDVVISLMGPAFGLITSVLGVVLYYATEMEIFAGVAVLSALLNLFNYAAHFCRHCRDGKFLDGSRSGAAHAVGRFDADQEAGGAAEDDPLPARRAIRDADSARRGASLLCPPDAGALQ